MEFIQLKCPNCNAMLEVEDTLDTCYCKYCGTKILISGQSDTVIKAKTELKMADKKLELEKERHRQEMEKEAVANKRANEAIIGLAIIVVVGLVLLFIIPFMPH